MIRNKLYYENRINLLINRGKENAAIVKKLQRKLRQLEAVSTLNKFIKIFEVNA